MDRLTNRGDLSLRCRDGPRRGRRSGRAGRSSARPAGAPRRGTGARQPACLGQGLRHHRPRQPSLRQPGDGPLAADRDRPALSVRRAGAAHRAPDRGSAGPRPTSSRNVSRRPRRRSARSRSARRGATSTAPAARACAAPCTRTSGPVGRTRGSGRSRWTASGPGLGLRLTEGELWAYSVESRDPVTGSNVRGHLYLHVTDHARAPHAMGGQPAIVARPRPVLPLELAARPGTRPRRAARGT